MKNSDSLHPAQYFSTDHLYLAAYLACHGYEVVRTSTASGSRVHFLFADSVELRSAAADFMAGGVVEARKFAFVLLRLKKKFPRFGE